MTTTMSDEPTQCGLPALQNLAYSQAEPEPQPAEAVSPWRPVCAQAARIGLLGAFAAMAIVGVSYAVPRHYSASYAVPQHYSAPTAPASPPVPSAAPSAAGQRLGIPDSPDMDHKLPPGALFLKLFNEGLAPYGRVAGPSAVDGGRAICDYLADGLSAEDIVEANTGVYDNGDRAAPDIWRVMIRAARIALCPELALVR